MAVNRFKDEYGSEWLETVAMTPQGIQPHSEEKEIVCLVWSLDAVEGRSPDTILMVQPNGMVETVGSIPSCISQTKKIIMKYLLEEALTLTVLTAMCMYGYLMLIAVV